MRTISAYLDTYGNFFGCLVLGLGLYRRRITYLFSAEYSMICLHVWHLTAHTHQNIPLIGSRKAPQLVYQRLAGVLAPRMQ